MVSGKKNQPKKRKKPAAATARKRAPRKAPAEIFDFCEGVLDETGEIASFSDKEKLFVLSYLTDAKFCQAKAARLAGYDAKTENAFRVIGCQMMKKFKIRSAINNALESLTMPKFENLYRVGEIAKNTIFDVMSEDGKTYDAEKAIETGAIHNISSIEFTEKVIEVESEAIETPDDLNLPKDERPPKEMLERTIIERKTKIRMYNKLNALKILTDVNFAKKHELTGAGGSDLPAAQVAFYLPSNGRGDSPGELAERAKADGEKKKAGG